MGTLWVEKNGIDFGWLFYIIAFFILFSLFLAGKKAEGRKERVKDEIVKMALKKRGGH